MSSKTNSISRLMMVPIPSSISYLWNIGFLLGCSLSIQLISGTVLSMSFINSSTESFQSLIHIMRDVNLGWAIRFTHSLVASLFFWLIFVHIARSLFFGSVKSKKWAWWTGVSMLMLSMLTAFVGYVLPWGQMSYWGATVITNMTSAVPVLGPSMVEWIWGNFSVSKPTMNRFFSIHLFAPLVILAFMMLHLAALHSVGSSTPVSLKEDTDKISFSAIFLLKDILFLAVVLMMSIFVLLNFPYLTTDHENMKEANPLMAPSHIKPEWYFLFAYTILRSIPSKLGGVVALVSSLLILYLVPTNPLAKNSKYSPILKIKFWLLIQSFLVLTFIGGCPVEPPFLNIGKLFSILYFVMIL